jgi:hypothetical protein
MTSQNIDLSSWDILYLEIRNTAAELNGKKTKTDHALNLYTRRTQAPPSSSI